jgi:hypothetical protein
MKKPLPTRDGFFSGVVKHWRNRNSKSQISNIKQITMTKIRNSKPVLVIEYWNLRFVCNLVLGVWDFIESNTPVLLRHTSALPYLLNLSQREAATPQMALKKSTSTGVISPRARPNIPLLAFIGKTMKNITREGPRLYKRPRLITERRSIGSKNRNPHIPPQTMRG